MWCTIQKKVVKDKAHLLKIIKLDTHVVHLPEEGRLRQCPSSESSRDSHKEALLKSKNQHFARYTWKVKQHVKATVQLKKEWKS
jgi:hypothetical protein